MTSLRARALAHRSLVSAMQFAVTGEKLPRRHRMLAKEIARGPHAFVLDLGCGNAPLLKFVEPQRYVGIDGHLPSLEAGRTEHARDGWEFVEDNVTTVSLSPWRGADVAVISSVTHHLPDEDVVKLVRRVADEIEPGRLLLQDAEPMGALGPLVTALDDGDHLRPRDALVSLLEREFAVSELWRYENPLRSFRQFLFELSGRPE